MLLDLGFKSLFQINFQFGNSETYERWNTVRCHMFPMNLSVWGNLPNKINTSKKTHFIKYLGKRERDFIKLNNNSVLHQTKKARNNSS